MLSADKFNQSNLISASSDKTIRVWNVERFEQVQYDDRHEAEVTALHANARHIMSGATDAKIKVTKRVNFRMYESCFSFRFGIV